MSTMQGLRATILSVGTELTTGFVRDTNIYYLSRALDALGITVVSATMLPDSRQLMRRLFTEAMNCSEIVIVTGGLGPTEDDFTKDVLLDLFGGEWQEDAATLQQIIWRLEKRNLPLNAINRQQAVVPSSAEILPNAYGMAPGMLFRYDGGILISLPGVPSEMQGLFETQVKPRIAAYAARLHHHPIYVFGVAESILSERLRTWNAELPEGMSLAYLPAVGRVCLRLTWQEDKMQPPVAKQCLESLYKLLNGDKYLSLEGSFEEYILKKLEAQNETLAIAESCTGGLLSAQITSVSGASKVYRGALCCYTNEIKIQELGIASTLLNKYSAVSAPVAQAMATAVREKFGTTYGIATTGYMEMEGTPPQTGEVYIAIATREGATVRHYTLNQNRTANQSRATDCAILELLLAIENW